MKELFKIFVEGDADKRFISQLLEFLFKTSIDQGNIIKTSGWNCLVSPKTEEVYVNQMNRTSADSGVNLVIFDADADFEDRKKKLILWKERCHVDFELFLFPNNKDTGELEDLLEKIINPENQPVMDCWTSYEEALKHLFSPLDSPRQISPLSSIFFKIWEMAPFVLPLCLASSVTVIPGLSAMCFSV